MKYLLLLAVCGSLNLNGATAQTQKELIGKWKLVKWTTMKGQDKAVDDSTFQVFNDNNQFISVAEGKEHKGKWKLSKDNQYLKIRSGIIVVDFKIDYFDAKRRVITSDKIGTLEYNKID